MNTVLMRLMFLCFAGFSMAGDQEVLMPLLEKNLGQRQFLQELATLEDKVSDLGMLEAKLVYGMRTRNWAFLSSLIPEHDKAAKQDPQVFSLMDRDSFYSIKYAILAQASLNSGNDAGFEQNIKQAWWESPTMGQVYADWVTEWKRNKRYENMRLPFDKVLRDTAGKEVVLKDIVKGQKALILDFWATWCRPCIITMPDVEPRSKEYAKDGVIWVGINTENSPTKAKSISDKYGISAPWLTEAANGPYSTLLQVDSIPRTVLVDAEGKIHFNGHPNDPGLDAAVRKLVGGN